MPAQVWFLPVVMGQRWERGELGVGGLTLSERCGWSKIWFTVLPEASGSCSLRERRRQVLWELLPLLQPIAFEIPAHLGVVSFALMQL